jgi:alkylated DNA repair dioxygenase AlkB
MDVSSAIGIFSKQTLEQLQPFYPPNSPPGLFIIPNWLNESDEQSIVDFVFKCPWNDHMSSKRPSQHYGFRYTSSFATELEKVETDWGLLKNCADSIHRHFPGISISQCLVNLYHKDSGIAAHRDKESPVVFGLSTLNDINMIWTKETDSTIGDSKLKYEALIPRRSLYIMSGDAALLWKHEIPSRATVRYPDANGNLTVVVKKPTHYERVSITFRHIDHHHVSIKESIAPRIADPPQPFDACHLKGMIPHNNDLVNSLFQQSDSAIKIYTTWLELFCHRILGIKVCVCNANIHCPDEKSLLSTIAPQVSGKWTVSLNLGEACTFELVERQPRVNSTAASILSVPLESGDLVLFAPEVDATHFHRIKSASKQVLILLCLLDILPGEDMRKLCQPPNEIRVNEIPTMESAKRVLNEVKVVTQ